MADGVLVKILGSTVDFEKSLDSLKSLTQKALSGVHEIGSKAADALKAAGTAAVGAVAAATTGVIALVKSSVNAYGEYEQLVGGVETLFGDSADEIQKYADKAYQTAGLSANDYMSTVTGFSASLVQSFSSTVEAVNEEEITANQEKLQQKYDDTASSYADEYDLLQESLSDQYDAAKQANADRLDELKDSLDKQYEAQKDALDSQYEAAKKSYDSDVEAFQAATDAKIAAINEQYAESLKLIDEEAYKQSEALNSQIDAIKKQMADAESLQKEKDIADRKAELEANIAKAKNDDDRIAAEKKLSDYLAKIEADRLKAERQAQIESLKQGIGAINDAAKEKKQAKKDELDATVGQIKEQSDAEKAALIASNNEKLQEIKSNNANILSALSEANAATVKAEKASGDATLAEAKKSNADVLKEKKASNKAQETALKESTKAQIKILEESKSAVVKTTVDTAEAQKKAAQYADVAISDMGDNANKMGTNMGYIQGAYQGFAKQNYTMLDNLKLGYGGTKTEMERLVADASKLDSSVDASSLSFGNIVKAIHATQVELGITGTTAKEAATTIQGSTASMKAAWSNVLTSISAGNDTLKGRIDELTESVRTAIGNIKPRVKEALNGISELVNTLLPQIMAEVPGIVGDVLPLLVDTVHGIITGICDQISKDKEGISTAITGALDMINDKVPAGIESATKAIATILDGLTENKDKIAETLNGVIESVLTSIDDIVASAGELIQKLAPALLDGVIKYQGEILKIGLEIVKNIVTGIADNAAELASSAVTVVTSLVQYLADNAGTIVGGVVSIITAFVSAFSNEETVASLTTGALTIVTELCKGIITAVPALLAAVPSIISGMITGLKNFVRENDAQYESWNKSYKEAKERIALIDEYNGKMDTLRGKLLEATNNALAQVRYTHGLTSELKLLADAEGHVDEKNQARAQFILNELNKAYGAEYTMVDGQIQKYKELCLEIDNLVAKKKWEIIESAALPLFEKAFAEEVNLRIQQNEAREALDKTQVQLSNYKNELLLKQEAANRDGMSQSYAIGINNLQKKIKDTQELYDKQSTALDGLTTAVRSNSALQTAYNNAQVEAEKGNYEKAFAALQIYTTKTEEELAAMTSSRAAAKAENERLFSQAKDTLTQYIEDCKNGVEEYSESTYQNIKAQAKAYYDAAVANGSNIYGGLVDGLSEGKEPVASSMGGLKNEVDVALDDTAKSANKKSKVVGANVDSGLEEGMDRGQTGVKASADAVGEKVLESFDATAASASAKGKTVADNFVAGIQSGIGSGESIIDKAAVQAANAVQTAFEKTLEIQSPSKVMRRSAQNVPKGVALGISDETSGILAAVKAQIGKIRYAYSNFGMGKKAQEALAADFTIKAASGADGGDKYTTNAPVINFYEPVETPDVVADKVDKIFRAGLVGANA